MRNFNSILGISLGTRTIGMAMLTNGELTDWYIKNFKGAWTEQKRDLILDTFERLMERYDIECISIKVPEQMDSHRSVSDLYLAINLFTQKKKIPTRTFTVEEIKASLGEGIKNKRILKEKVLGLYPELRHEFTKDYLRRNAYYAKLFEAVAAAHLLHRAETDNR